MRLLTAVSAALVGERGVRQRSPIGRTGGAHTRANAGMSSVMDVRTIHTASQMPFCPYRTPTPVGRGNAPQVDERTSVKELGKLTPYLRKKGCPSSLLFCEQRARGPQETGSSDCLPKTQVSANAQADV